jgi:hypothetical protein
MAVGLRLDFSENMTKSVWLLGCLLATCWLATTSLTTACGTNGGSSGPPSIRLRQGVCYCRRR